MRNLITTAMPSRCLLIAVGASVILAGCSSSTPKTTSTTSVGAKPSAAVATAKGASVSGNCSTQGSEVVCLLPASGNSIDLTTLVSEAAAVDSSVTSGTTVAIGAVGGSGGVTEYHGNNGTGGVAQTNTTVANYEKAFGTTNLYYYLGGNGYPGADDASASSNANYAPGGASTIVSSQDLNADSPCISGYGSCTSTNVVLLAGGGGAEGRPETCQAGAGGNGGTAVATTDAAVSGAGTDGNPGNCSGGAGGGKGGNAGAGGSGGKAGGGSDPHDGKGGASGIGGLGGPYHKSNGPGNPTYWENGTTAGGSGAVKGVGTNGEGGEGEWRGSQVDNAGSGGGGGGGYGGGGGGGGGGFDFAGGGGGGGGSYAAEATVAGPNVQTSSSTSSTVVITFLP
jgi:hypothetical protein